MEVANTITFQAKMQAIHYQIWPEILSAALDVFDHIGNIAGLQHMMNLRDKAGMFCSVRRHFAVILAGWRSVDEIEIEEKIIGQGEYI